MAKQNWTRELTNNPKHGLDKIYHFANKQDHVVWFGNQCVSNEHVTLAKKQ